MSDYNLTQRERQIVFRLLDLSQQSKDHFEAIPRVVAELARR